MKSHIHVDAELLAAWFDRSLPKDEAAKVEAHLASCDHCQEVLAAFARTSPPPPVAAPMWQRWRLGWVVPIAAAATVAAIWVAIPEDERATQLNRTAAPVSESAARSAPAAADAVAPAVKKPEQKAVTPRRDAPSSSLEARAEKTERAEKESSPAGKAEPFATPRATEVRERDQSLSQAAENAAAAATSTPATPPAAPAQSRVGSPSGLVARQAPAEVVSPDPLVRWRIVPSGRLERSTDGGKTWAAVALPEEVTVTTVVAPAATTAIVIAADGRQFRTIDQGKTWNLIQP